jgi:hypothetical protein
MLNQGDLKEATAILSEVDGKKAWARAIHSTLNTSLQIKGNIVYRKEGDSQIYNLALTSEALRNLVLTHRDYYRLELGLLKSVAPLYMYIFQLDSQGNIDRLYPRQLWGTSNPLQPDIKTVNIPAGKAEWLYLSKPTQETHGLIKERLILLMAPFPAADIEMLFEAIQTTKEVGQRRLLIDKFLLRLNQRSEAQVPAVHVEQVWFWHGKK